MTKEKEIFTPPIATKKILLHSCCAPCSAAIIEALLKIEITPTIFYYNPNIYPEQEYLLRKNECSKYSDNLGLIEIDGDYNHSDWLKITSGYENEPERGARCQLCFNMRLLETAKKAKELGFELFTTTLASSRWKNLEQINEAGKIAETITGVKFWAQNWRKGGLQQRRNELLKENNFYNQQYCGCQFSWTNNK